MNSGHLIGRAERGPWRAARSDLLRALAFYRSAKKSVCTNWISGTLTVLTIVKIVNSTTQSNPMLIPSGVRHG
jgi:hypothetical protein